MNKIMSTGPVKFALGLEIFHITCMVAAFFTDLFVLVHKNVFSDFFWVVTLVIFGFILLNIKALLYSREMNNKANAILSIKFSSNTDSLYDGGQASYLN